MTTDWLSVFSRVKSALRHRGRSDHDADDLVQEAFVRLTCYERKQTVDKPEAFLMTTAINLSTDHHRRSARRGEEVMLEDVVIVDTAPRAEDVLLSRERLNRLSECISRLNDKTRAIFLAHRVDGLTYREIAQIHGLSISSVEKHVAKAALVVTAWMEGW